MPHYFQQTFRDYAGDLHIQQFEEQTRPSGLVTFEHVSTVSVMSPVSTEDLLQMLNLHELGFVYVPAKNEDRTKAPRTPLFSLEPHARNEFVQLSARAIVDAYNRRTFKGVSPHMQFIMAKDESDVTDDDSLMLRSVIQEANTIMHGTPQSPPPMGQYI